jgi:hypothetical protein
VQTIVELAASLLGVQPAELEAPDARLLQTLLLSPSEQVRDLQEALRVVAGGQGNADSAAVRDMTAQVVDALMGRAAERLGVEADTLFPMRRSLLDLLERQGQPAAAAQAARP